MQEQLDFSNASVLVVGDLMLDKYWHSDVQRISPEAPIPVAHFKREEQRVGGAGNVALNCVTLGAKTKLLGIVGEDDNGAAIRELLADQSVSFETPDKNPHPTISKIRVMSRGQQLLRLDFEDPIPSDFAEALVPQFEVALSEATVVVLSDYGKGTLTSSASMLAMAKAAGKITIVDPKGTDFERYRGASIVTPNFGEFTAVVGPCKDEAEIVDKARELALRFDFNAVLVTRSELGMLLVPAEGGSFSVPAKARAVFDVTGAGDTVVAALAAALAAGMTLEDSVAIANVCASIVVAKVGTSSVTLGELIIALASKDNLKSDMSEDAKAGRGKIISLRELGQIREYFKKTGRSLVMTNGCFDILHAGHVAYLAEAARRGDVLAIAVNSDASVRGLKGDDRPFNSLEARMNVLASLHDIDWLVSFDEQDPDLIYQEIVPDVLVKGADYAGKTVVGADHVTAAGGRVELIEFLDGYSTTAIADRIRGHNE